MENYYKSGKRTGHGSNTMSKCRHHFFPKQFNFCDSNVNKCLPVIRFCSNIFFCTCIVCHEINNMNIHLFIRIINLIHDDCIN